jgi:hypothetical protein
MLLWALAKAEMEHSLIAAPDFGCGRKWLRQIEVDLTGKCEIHNCCVDPITSLRRIDPRGLRDESVPRVADRGKGSGPSAGDFPRQSSASHGYSALDLIENAQILAHRDYKIDTYMK